MEKKSIREYFSMVIIQWKTLFVMQMSITDQGHPCSKAGRDGLEKDGAKTYLSLSNTTKNTVT